MVSLGTGNLKNKQAHSELKNLNILNWASMIPKHFMSDANFYNQLIMQIISNSPTAKTINSEVGDLSLDKLSSGALLSYLRYDFFFEKKTLEELGFHFSKKELKKFVAMDNPRSMKILYDIGSKVAEKQIKKEHFLQTFSLNQLLSKM